MNTTKRSVSPGFLTLEILMALVIIILAISAVIVIVFGSQRMTLDGQLTIEALHKARDRQGQTRALVKTDWNNIRSLVIPGGMFTENITAKDMDDFLKSVITKVSWQSEARPRSVELATLLFNKDEALGQGSCAAGATGDWANPQSIQVALGTTGEITGVDVKNGIAYVTADGNGTQKDFFAVNVATSPAQVLWSMDTGPGLLAVKVSGNFAYVANTSINSQLQIINLTAHTFLGYKIPGSSTGTTANTLYYFNHHVYVGLPKSSIEEFHIFDVTDLNNVHEVGKFELNVGINGIYVSNNIAYVATPDNQELKMLDVHEAGHISLVGGYDAPGGSGNGKSFARNGQRLFLGRTTGNNELYLLNINDIHSGAKASANINSSVNGLATMGNLVFLATTDTAKEFQVWQISPGDTSFTLTSILNFTNQATAVDCEGQTVYATSKDPAHGLTIITAP